MWYEEQFFFKVRYWYNTIVHSGPAFVFAEVGELALHVYESNVMVNKEGNGVLTEYQTLAEANAVLESQVDVSFVLYINNVM